MSKQSSDAASLRPAVLLTRPAAASARFATAVTERFEDRVEVILSPLMHPVFFQPAVPGAAFEGVVFTSEAGVEGAHRLNASGISLPSRAYCVGDLTARAASAAGFDACSAGGDAAQLLAMIQRARPTGPLLYLHGRETRGDLAERLNSAGIETHSAQIYQQESLPPSPDALARLAQTGPVLIPIFSPRSATLLAADLASPTAPLYLVAMSAAVAANARTIPHRALQIAQRPDAVAMLDALEVLLNLTQAP